MANAAPKMLGKWKMHRALDSVAFGVAWLAEDSTKPGTYAVIKFLAGSPLEEPIEVTQARFEREREILAGLNNQHVCKLLDDDLNHNPPWVAVDYLPGKSLQGTISESYKLNETEWFRLASDMLNGLSYLHKQKIIHRDLNPKNILVTSIGYKIIDFGISYKQGLPQVTVGNLRHLLFCSPEQLQTDGKITAKSDIFSLATLLVYAGTNRSPWTNDPSAMTEKMTPLAMSQIPNNTVSSEPLYFSLSSNQKMFLRELHHKDPAKRPSADEALELLKKLATRAFLSPVTSAPIAKKPVQGAKPKPRVVKKAPLPPVKKPRTVAQLQELAKLNISENRVEVIGSAPTPKVPKAESEKNFFEKYWVDLLVAWIATPVGWVIYRSLKDKEFANRFFSPRSSNNFKALRISYLVTHALTAGLFAPIVGIPLAIRARRRKVSIFVASNCISMIIVWNAIVSAPSGEAVQSGPTAVLLFNYVFGFFLPLAMREKKRVKKEKKVKAPKVSKVGAPEPTLIDTGKIDPFDDEDSLADAHEQYQAAAMESPTWEKLHIIVKEVLQYETLDRFIVEFSKTNVSGIYFQGFREDDGAITIEAAANLSVRPEITSEQNTRIIKAGWEPPVGNNPNYAQFLSVEESTLENVSTLIINTLRNGYGASLDGLEPVFSVSNGGEMVYVNFAEFKRLTS